VRSTLASLLLGLLLPACASLPTEAPADPSVLRLTGRVRQEEGMAAPPGATLRVALHDLSRADGFPRVVAYQDTWPGRRASYPFLVQLDRGLLDPERGYGLSAQVFDAEARLLWATERVQPVSTESPGPVGLVVRGVQQSSEPRSEDAVAAEGPQVAEEPTEPEPPAAPAVPTRTGARTMSFDCDGLAVTVHVEDQRVRLVLPDRALVLARVQGRAGEEYGHPGAIVRLRGEALFLELGGRVYRTCEPRAP
jgi:uncharacterized lipoprotein YbaY